MREIKVTAGSEVSCANCEACCCLLEVQLITDTGVPDQFIQYDKWGGSSPSSG